MVSYGTVPNVTDDSICSVLVSKETLLYVGAKTPKLEEIEMVYLFYYQLKKNFGITSI